MRFRSSAAAAFTVFLAASSEGLADGYPFTGLFTYPDASVAAGDAQLLCAYNFFSQNADGTFVNYHLDLPLYRKDGTIRFLVFTRGHCAAEGGKVETCTTDWDSEKDNEGQVYFDVLTGIGPGTIDIANFDTVADARSFLADRAPEPASIGRFYRCPFDDAAIARYRTEVESTIAGDDRTNMITPELDDETRATMTAVLSAIGAGK